MTNIKRSIYLLLGYLMLTCSCAKTNDLKTIAENMRVSFKIPGMAVAIVKPDSILEMFTLGYRRNGYPDKIRIDDRFHIGSNTKSMTSFVAGHLVEKEIIDWTTKFIDLYPEWKAVIDSSYWNNTLGDLLSHRGRIQAFWTDVEFDSIHIDQQAKSDQRTEFNRYALSRKPIIPDSMGFLYSNAGYTIASQMLEKVSNSTWEELMIKVLNEDLNLDIGFSWPNKKDHQQPWGHWTKDGKLVPCPPDDDYNLDWLEPGGDINISLPNYIKFIQLNMHGIMGNDNYLKATTYDILHIDREGPVYAHGWADFIHEDHNYSYHAGSAGTFLVEATIDRSESIAYIIMMNTSSPAAQVMMKKLRKRMEKRYGLKKDSATI